MSLVVGVGVHGGEPGARGEATGLGLLVPQGGVGQLELLAGALERVAVLEAISIEEYIVANETYIKRHRGMETPLFLTYKTRISSKVWRRILSSWPDRTRAKIIR